MIIFDEVQKYPKARELIKYLVADGRYDYMETGSLISIRKNVKDMPGKPDIVLPRYKTVIFIHGCYWHRHKGCKNCTTPSTRRDFWLQKFEKNVQNDLKHKTQLENAGWKVLVLWECQIENNFEALMTELVGKLRGTD